LFIFLIFDPVRAYKFRIRNLRTERFGRRPSGKEGYGYKCEFRIITSTELEFTVTSIRTKLFEKAYRVLVASKSMARGNEKRT